MSFQKHKPWLSSRWAYALTALMLGGLGIGALLRSAQSPANVYVTKILVANRTGLGEGDGALIDEHLVNPWGLALRPPGAGGHFWICNAGNLSASTFVGDAHGKPLHQDGLKIVYLKGPLISYEDGLANVTGQVYNAASDFPDQPLEFPVSGSASDLSVWPRPIGTVSGPAKFVFVTTEGTINAWRSSTAESMDAAVIVKDYSDHGPDQIPGSHLPAFTGVAMSQRPGGRNRLYVADFQNKLVRVLSDTWTDITAQVQFARPAGMPDEFSPFNIQFLGDRLYVAFAALDPDGEEPATDIPAPGEHDHGI